MNARQLDMFEKGAEEKDTEEKFIAWKETDGGKMVMRELVEVADWYSARYMRSGIKTSMKLLWELQRDRIKEHKYIHVEFRKVDGYTLNNNFTSHIAREVERRLDCVGLFEKRHMKK